MMRAILVTELERAIINALRSTDDATRGMVLTVLEFPYTPASETLLAEIEEESNNRLEGYCSVPLYKELEKKGREALQAKRLKAYREAGYTGPLEFGTEAAKPYIWMLEEQKGGRAE